MADQKNVHRTVGEVAPTATEPAGDPCIMVIFGASGDLTKRLLMPAIYNLACDGLLPEHFAIIGVALTEMDTDGFRDQMSQDIREFSTRSEFDSGVWDNFVNHLYYTCGNFDDPAAYKTLVELIKNLDEQYGASNNILFYMATPPVVFGMISGHLEEEGLNSQANGWRRIIVEKPFGHDLQSAIDLNKEILAYWDESQVFRIDHYLGKETVQNILAFRFSNGIFEPLWNNKYIDHIQFTVSESVGVEGRGGYYETSGVLRDMMQNHMFQMLAYLCMEAPTSFESTAIRNEKGKLLQAVRVMEPEDVLENAVRGQYGPGTGADGKEFIAYRDETDVDPKSSTETFAAVKLFIDNWRFAGIPVYLRSGKALGKRDTEILIQFRKAPAVIFRDTPVDSLSSNQLIFHIQPDQGIELRFQAKVPGPVMHLQDVNMHFAYQEAFKASRGTGYEVMVYDAMIGESMLFSSTDLVETAWEIAQPLLDIWGTLPPRDFPNYAGGSWGPKIAFDLIERDGRQWMDLSG